MSLGQHYNYCELRNESGSISRWNTQVSLHWISRHSEQLIIVILYIIRAEQSNVLLLSHLKTSQKLLYLCYYFLVVLPSLEIIKALGYVGSPSEIHTLTNHPSCKWESLAAKRETTGSPTLPCPTLRQPLTSICLSRPAQCLSISFCHIFYHGNAVNSQYGQCSQLKWSKDVSSITSTDSLKKNPKL